MMGNAKLNSMILEFLSLPVNVGLARIAVASFAAQIDMTLNELEEIKIAVSEAVSNALIHGYQQKKDGRITLIANRYQDYLEIIVEDKGRGITDVAQTLPSGTNDPESLGLGFVFIKSFMDQVEISSKVNEGTRIVMVKYLNKCIPATAQEN